MFSVHLTKSAKDNTFDSCVFNGEVKNEGMRNHFVRSVFNAINKQPKWLITIEIIVGVATVLGTVFTILSYYRP